MFENVSPIQSAHVTETALTAGGFIVPAGAINAEGADARGGDALRAIGWSELAARINAARDLRAVLRRDAAPGSVSVASFGDAAANYFAARGQGERPVNPIDLEARKASAAITPHQEAVAAKGDRETTND